jgi:hypothetical protein
MPHRTLSIFVALLVTVACDPLTDAEKPPSSDVTVKDGKPRDPSATVAKGVPADAPGEFASCLLGCDTAQVRPADRAACRFNCERPSAAVDSGYPPAASDADPVEYATVCFNRCFSEGLNAESCLGACKTRAAASPAAPAANVLDELGTCLGVCHASKHMKATDHATCELNCAQAARVAGPAPIVGAVAKTR